MKLRLRSLIGFALLVALSLTGVEAVWASACIPGMGAETMETGAMAPASGGHSDADCQNGMGGSHPVDPEPDAPAEAPHCPFGPMTASGVCTPAPPLPADASPARVPHSEGAVRVNSLDQVRDHLMVSAFFRPPRA